MMTANNTIYKDLADGDSHNTKNKSSDNNALFTLKPEHSNLLTNLGILDYFTHQVNHLRLKYCQYSYDLDEKGTHSSELESDLGLAMASLYVALIQKLSFIIESEATITCAGRVKNLIALDPAMQKRRLFHQLIGLAFFNADESCSEFDNELCTRGSCCKKHQMKGWKVLATLLEEVDIPDTEIGAMLELIVDIRTSVVIYGAENKTKWNELLNETFPLSALEDNSNLDLIQTQAALDDDQETVLSVYQRSFNERRALLVFDEETEEVGNDDFLLFQTEMQNSFDLRTVCKNLFNWIKARYEDLNLEHPKLLVVTENLIGNLLTEPEQEDEQTKEHKKEKSKQIEKDSKKRSYSNSGERIQWSESDDLHSSKIARMENLLNDLPTRKRRPFSEQETANLISGIKKYGHHWATIRNKYNFDGRTNIDLKDKARNLARRGLIQFVESSEMERD